MPYYYVTIYIRRVSACKLFTIRWRFSAASVFFWVYSLFCVFESLSFLRCFGTRRCGILVGVYSFRQLCFGLHIRQSKRVSAKHMRQ